MAYVEQSWYEVRVQAVPSQPRQGMLQEDGGFSSFGMCCLSERKTSPYSVHVTSPVLTYIVMEREKVDELLGVRESACLCGLIASGHTDLEPCVLGHAAAQISMCRPDEVIIQIWTPICHAMQRHLPGACFSSHTSCQNSPRSCWNS